MIRLADIAKLFYRFYAKPRTDCILKEILTSMSKCKPVHILQVGANDGVLYDPIQKTLLRRSNVSATRIEPISEYFEELQANCAQFASRVELFNICIAEEDGFIEMFIPEPAQAKHTDRKGHGSLNPEAAGRSRHGLAVRQVTCKSFRSLMNAMRQPRADVYVSDCEGYDIQLLKQLPIRELGIKVVYIELVDQSMSHEHVASALKDAIDVVSSHGFNRIIWDGNDFLSWQSPRQSRSQLPMVEGFTG